MRHMRSKVTYTDRLTYREADKAMAIGEIADLSKKNKSNSASWAMRVEENLPGKSAICTNA